MLTAGSFGHQTNINAIDTEVVSLSVDTSLNDYAIHVNEANGISSLNLNAGWEAFS